MNIKNTFTALLVVALLAMLAPPMLDAQTATTRTYTTVAMDSGSTTMTVASATGMVASTNSAPTWLVICDGATLLPSTSACEVMRLVEINSLVLTVRRGQSGGSGPIAHPSNSLVWYGKTGNLSGGNTGGVFLTTTPSGTCTRASNAFLPVINTSTGEASDCILSLTSTTSKWTAVNLYQRAQALPYKKLPILSTTYTTLPTDRTVGYNTNVNGTITLCACIGNVGQQVQVQIEVTGTHSVTIAASGSQTINGAASIVIGGSTSFAGVTIYSDGSNWWTPRAQ